MNLELARALVAQLPESRDGFFNPWCAWHELDDRASPDGGPEGRVLRLAHHLARRPRHILCGEAPGFAGAKTSGIAFASERQLIDGLIPGVPRLGGRLTLREASFAEQSATILWRALYRLRMQDEVITWNAIQMHPHRPGQPWTNRTPTNAELEHGKPCLALLCEAFPDAQWVAIGKKAAQLLHDAGITPAASLRHPANGGAGDFNAGLERLTGLS
ncbi:uracil-DNA glycosylase [Rubrivivax gelatinosus]|uniref:uracil-DNA glycosylase n=1 Tax=Rubrivivax gelatinosus TaxID=28068 RepID=UPI0005C1C44E|nr:uracil-DNA glycosylase [Rubrivivax gelatinosus]MBG6083094.1 hypothetical protein [Rubrivivax gelatinosus]